MGVGFSAAGISTSKHVSDPCRTHRPLSAASSCVDRGWDGDYRSPASAPVQLDPVPAVHPKQWGPV